jgi:hypothetical protein
MTPRLTVEDLKDRLSIRTLLRLRAFPPQRQLSRVNYIEAPFRFPFIRSLRVGLTFIEVRHHSGRIQTLGVRWISTGHVGDVWHRRPLLVCNCGKAAQRLFSVNGHVACRHCLNIPYASDQCSKGQRQLLKRKRIEFRLEHQSMYRRKRRRYETQLQALPKPDRARLSQRYDVNVLMPVNWID